MKVNDLVAVYGSLRHGLGNHRLLIGAERHEDGIIPKGFKMLSMSAYPCLTPSEDSTPVVVEVYTVDSVERQRALDRLEGYPSFYNRRQVKLEDGRTVWVYFIEEPHIGLAEVNSGDWKSYLLGD